MGIVTYIETHISVASLFPSWSMPVLTIYFVMLDLDERILKQQQEEEERKRQRREKKKEKKVSVTMFFICGSRCFSA